MWIFFYTFFSPIVDKLDKQNIARSFTAVAISVVCRFLVVSWFYDYAIKSDEIISQLSSTSIYLLHSHIWRIIWFLAFEHATER